jgi:hypothetical protein
MLDHPTRRETTRVANRDLLRTNAAACRCQITDVQHVERRERETLSVRGRAGAANLRDRETESLIGYANLARGPIC